MMTFMQKENQEKEKHGLKNLLLKCIIKVLQAFTRIEIQKDTGDFRLLDRRCIEALKSIRETQRYTKGLFSWIGYNKKKSYMLEIQEQQDKQNGITGI